MNKLVKFLKIIYNNSAKFYIHLFIKNMVLIINLKFNLPIEFEFKRPQYFDCAKVA